MQPIDLIVDNGTRRRVIDFYNSSQRLDSDGAAYAYKDLKSKKEQLVSPNVEAFRDLVKTAHAIVNEAKELKQQPGESDDSVLTSVQKMETDPREDFSRVMSSAWSFYVPDDAVAMKQLSALMEKVMNANPDMNANPEKPSEGQSSRDNEGPGAIFRRFMDPFHKINLRGSMRKSYRLHKKFYEELIKLAEYCEKYIPTTPESSTTQP